MTPRPAATYRGARRNMLRATRPSQLALWPKMERFKNARTRQVIHATLQIMITRKQEISNAA